MPGMRKSFNAGRLQGMSVDLGPAEFEGVVFEQGRLSKVF
jgi:hypothetical protein